MFDKDILIKRFKRSLPTYSDNAFIQKKMADNLLKMLPKKVYKNVLEIGCGSGILTNKFIKDFKYGTYLATDIVDDSKKYISVDFKQTDMDNLKLEQKYDLIISNAAIQWSNDKEKLITKLSESLDKDGILALTTFGPQNMKEIRELFNVGLEYNSIQELEPYFKNLIKVKLFETVEQLQFNDLFDVLRHIKQTGTNIFTSNKLKKNSLKYLSEEYSDKYKNILTYNPMYFIFKN